MILNWLDEALLFSIECSFKSFVRFSTLWSKFLGLWGNGSTFSPSAISMFGYANLLTTMAFFSVCLLTFLPSPALRYICWLLFSLSLLSFLTVLLIACLWFDRVVRGASEPPVLGCFWLLLTVILVNRFGTFEAYKRVVLRDSKFGISKFWVWVMYWLENASSSY